ncbi:MAG TPA: SIMPL domain-containing protein [Stellaceae bacterium]|nr:SIMPL domain-containing protein [Stellaceae bacterium]
MRRVVAGAAFLLALLPLAAPAADAPAPNAAGAVTLLHLSDTATRQVVRDRLHAVLRVEAADADPAKLQAEINRRLAAAVARAKGVAGVSLFTGGYQVFAERPRSAPVRWHGAASLSLTAAEAPPLLALVGQLQQSDLVVSSLAYELSPEATRSAEDALTTEALARLRQRAERVAASLGLAVLGIRDLRVGNAVAPPPMPRVFMASAALSSSAPAPVAEPGEATVSVSVDADIALGPR